MGDIAHGALDAPGQAPKALAGVADHQPISGVTARTPGSATHWSTANSQQTDHEEALAQNHGDGVAGGPGDLLDVVGHPRDQLPLECSSKKRPAGAACG